MGQYDLGYPLNKSIEKHLGRGLSSFREVIMDMVVPAHVEVFQGLPGLRHFHQIKLLAEFPDDLFLSIGGQTEVRDELELFPAVVPVLDGFLDEVDLNAGCI